MQKEVCVNCGPRRSVVFADVTGAAIRHEKRLLPDIAIPKGEESPAMKTVQGQVSRIDLAKQNTGEVRAWRLRGDAIIANVSLGFASPDWEIVGFGDFTGAGRQDVLWPMLPMARSLPGSWTDLQLSRNGSQALSRSTGRSSDADLNGNGVNSILWSDVSTGQQAIWSSNGSTFVPAAPFAVAPCPGSSSHKALT